MSAAAEFLVFERLGLPGRLWAAARRLARRREVVLVTASVGLVATFAGMLASGTSGPIGTIMFVPWVALFATQLGPAAGAVAGVGATALYLTAAEMVGLPHDPVTLLLRLAPLVGVGVAAGVSSRRISSHALELQATSAVLPAKVRPLTMATSGTRPLSCE